MLKYRRMTRIKTYFKKPWFLISAAAVILIGFWIYNSSRPVPPAYAVVARGTVTEEVSVTGQVEAAQDVSLAFEKGGTVSRVYVKVGDDVPAGAPLVALNSQDAYAALASAQADADAAAAKLAELQNGPRPEELAVKQTALDQAELTLANAYSGVANTLQTAYVNADDAVRKQSDQFFTNGEDPNPALAFQTFDFQAGIDSENGRVSSGVSLNDWKTALAALGPASPPAALDQAVLDAQNRLLGIQNFLNNLSDALVSETNLSASALTAYQTELNTARTDITTALGSVNSTAQTIAADKLAVTQAQDDLNLTKAGSTPEDIQAQQATLESAQAKVLGAQADLAKTMLRAPIAGVVTEEDAKTGEIAAAGDTVVRLMSAGKFQVVAQVPETDIGRVTPGNAVSMTFDALPGATFSGRVASIDPAETVIEGVATYKTTVDIDPADPRIRSGLTADMSILVASHDNALYLPQRAVTTQSGKRYVMFAEPGGTLEQREVQTGLRGAEGQVEIVSGLAEGDRVLASGVE